jgi:N-acylglucosamine-6-phosphate 2-epimerase
LVLIASLRGLIVSCQAPVGSPLREPLVIAALAEAACLSGAVGVRIESPEHVRAVRSRIDKPIVGLWKRDYAGFEVYITPTFADAEAIAKAGADIIAIDGTGRKRPNGETLSELIRRIHVELQKPVLADIATFAEAEAAVRAGADVVVTTLCGHTAETKGTALPALDLLETMIQSLDLPVWCEGGVNSPEQFAQALHLGAKVVVVGTALTGLEVLVKRYLDAQ